MTTSLQPNRTPDKIHEHSLIVLRKLDSAPLIKGKMYLRLFHGRNTIDEELNSWGFEGPTFGPLDHFHATYLTTFSMYGATSEAELLAVEDMFVFEGKYYGDMTIFIA